MPARPTLGTTGEFGFLDRVLPRVPAVPGTLVGPGHDCALVRLRGREALFTVDALVEGVHFDWRWMRPRDVGRKAFLVNASDIAAMGGRPRFCVVAIGAPPGAPLRTLRGVQEGLVDAALRHGAAVVGGNLARAGELSVTVALLGDPPRRQVTRAGARPGHQVYVTGTLGDAAAALRLLLTGAGVPPAAAHRRLVAPEPRLAAGRWLAETGVASAMIDVSDGLRQDLAHVCTASGVGAVVHAEALPRSAAYRAVCGEGLEAALAGGEDYELLFTVAPRDAGRLAAAGSRLGCPVTRIGEIVAGRGVRVVDARGRTLRGPVGGWDHFARSAAAPHGRGGHAP